MRSDLVELKRRFDLSGQPERRVLDVTAASIDDGLAVQITERATRLQARYRIDRNGCTRLEAVGPLTDGAPGRTERWPVAAVPWEPAPATARSLRVRLDPAAIGVHLEGESAGRVVRRFAWSDLLPREAQRGAGRQRPSWSEMRGPVDLVRPRGSTGRSCGSRSCRGVGPARPRSSSSRGRRRAWPSTGSRAMSSRCSRSARWPTTSSSDAGRCADLGRAQQAGSSTSRRASRRARLLRPYGLARRRPPGVEATSGSAHVSERIERDSCCADRGCRGAACVRGSWRLCRTRPAA